MTHHSIQPLPPKVLADLVRIIREGEAGKDFVTIGNDIWEFARPGNIVATVIGPLNCASGHQQRSPYRHADIKRRLEARK